MLLFVGLYGLLAQGGEFIGDPTSLARDNILKDTAAEERSLQPVFYLQVTESLAGGLT